jgi:protein-S-isoprenylcysteine O-methyltransferase Ste14
MSYTYRMPADTFDSTVDSYSHSTAERAWPMRMWLAAPDWMFRALGLVFFTIFTLYSAQKYWDGNFWNFVPWCTLPDGTVIRMSWVPVLIDLTYLLIAASFILRVNPRRRASDGHVILVTLFTAFAPFIFVMWLPWGLGRINEDWETAYFQFLWRDSLTWYAALIGGVLITMGNILDVWGYLVLCRSFGIVPEARELKTTGPYRFVRHPVYLGQFLAQGGVWLFFARTHLVWIGLYLAFVGMQLYRSKLEDRVLAAAFGEQYEAYQRRTFWFV